MSKIKNSYTIDNAVDAQQSTVLTTVGQTAFPAGLTWEDLVADAYRMVLPNLRKGYQRVSIEFAVSADGLSADWTVVDRQAPAPTPTPSPTPTPKPAKS